MLYNNHRLSPVEIIGIALVITTLAVAVLLTFSLAIQAAAVAAVVGIPLMVVAIYKGFQQASQKAILKREFGEQAVYQAQQMVANGLSGFADVPTVQAGWKAICDSGQETRKEYALTIARAWQGKKYVPKNLTVIQYFRARIDAYQTAIDRLSPPA